MLALRPAPFGISWTSEERGGFTIVQDDREISGYDRDGLRVWKRAALGGKMAFATERVSIVPTAHGIELMEADLAIGSFTTRLRLDGSMRYIGAHATLAEPLVFFATDERFLFVVDTERFEIVQRHELEGNHLLRPLLASGAVHVAAVGERSTNIVTLDRTSGRVLSLNTVPGTAHALTAGKAGLVIDTVRRVGSAAERIAFRPDSPSAMLIAPRDVRLRDQLPALPAGNPVRAAEVHVIHQPLVTNDGRHSVIVPMRTAPNDPSRPGFLALLALLGAQSEVLPRIVDQGDRLTMSMLNLTLRDPRVRFSTEKGRDPCLLDLAQTGEGDSICAYWYPAASSRTVPVVRVDATGRVHWISENVDRWFASVLHEARPGAAKIVTTKLDLPDDFPQPLAREIPPAWFALAHEARFTVRDAEEARRAGDIEGAERMLVSARDGMRELIAVYEQLGWSHHRAIVAETW